MGLGVVNLLQHDDEVGGLTCLDRETDCLNSDTEGTSR